MERKQSADERFVVMDSGPGALAACHLGPTVAAPYGGYRPPGAVDGPAAVVRLPRLKGKEA